MSRLALIVVALVLGSLGAACHGAAAPPPAPVEPAVAPIPQQPVIARVTAYERAACACSTVECLAAVERELTTWAEAHEGAIEEFVHDRLRLAQLDAHLDRVYACRKQLEGGTSPGERADRSYRDADDAIAEMGELANELCACADTTCAEGVMTAAWSGLPCGRPSRCRYAMRATASESGATGAPLALRSAAMACAWAWAISRAALSSAGR